MTSPIAIAATTLLPLTSLLSLSIYLSSHPTSPLRPYFHHRQRIALPTQRDEGLDTEKDPFDIDDPNLRSDGNPLGEDQFWASMRWKKIALVFSILAPIGINVALLVLTALSNADLVAPIFILAAQLPVLLIAIWHIGQVTTETSWPTTVTLAVNIALQALTLTILSLLPSTPVPSRHTSSHILMYMPLFKNATTIDLLTALQPIAYIPPALLVLCFIRRGPPLHMPVETIYSPKYMASIPEGHSCLDQTLPNVTAEVQASVIEILMFSYATPVIKKGYVNQSLDLWDVPLLPANMRAMANYQRFKAAYGRPRNLAKMEGFNLLWKVARVNWLSLSIVLLITFATAVGYYLPHYILQLFIVYLENDPRRTDPSWGLFLAFSLFSSNAAVFIGTQMLWSIASTTLQTRVSLQLNSLLFNKTLTKKDVASGGKQGQEGKEEEDKNSDEEDVTSKSQIMTLFTVDVDRVKEFIFHTFAVIDSPVELVVATVFLFNLLGTSALWGLLTTLLFMPLTHLASKIVVRVQENLMKARDKRTGLMNEVLSGVRMLKFMAWERSFERRVNDIRKDELHWIASNYRIELLFSTVWDASPVIAIICSFIHFTLVAGHTLTPSIAFTSISVFGELQYALSALPETFINALQGFVSCQRIERYMMQPDISSPTAHPKGADVVLTNATFSWPTDEAKQQPLPESNGSTPATPKHAFTLADLTLRFPAGKLSLICGRLGSGKSLLLAGLLGEADLLAGNMQSPRSSPNAMDSLDQPAGENDWVLPGVTAFVPQQAWLQNASIRDNITFNSPWDAARYDQVIKACSLVTDLQILEDGDETEIGEKGLNLSGGQKARVSLARAIYSRASTLFLDDVLSAVDAHTAQAIMDNCFNGPITSGRTIILVSHHTALVSPSASYIVALENGDVKFSGTRNDFVDGGLMAKLEAEDSADPSLSPVEEKKLEDSMFKAAPKNLASLAAEDSGPSSETSSIAPDDEATLFNSEADIKRKSPRKLIEDEKRSTGRIAWPIWKTYMTSLGGPIWWIIFVLGLLLAMVGPVAGKGWLGYWTGAANPGREPHSVNYYVFGYALIAIGGVLVHQLQFAIIYYGSIQAGAKLHAKLLETVLFAPLRFHDTTSRGRLLNRFGKDIETVDSEMADNFLKSLMYALNVLVTFSSIAYVGGLPFVVAILIVTVLYYRVGSIYGPTSRDMRRLNSTTRSPLYSLFGETVAGVSVIRAFGASTISLKRMLELADTNLLAFVWSWTVNRWISARFNLLSSLVIGVTAIICLYAPGVNASMAGFALAFANTSSHDLLFVVRRFVQLEQSMVALERIKEYSEIEQEAPEFSDPRPEPTWPNTGTITVEKLVVRYAPELPNVLHAISFDVAAKEKIGIVGPTGCGKSTLALSFFRFVEAHSGKISIDGIDISSIGLTDLRSRVTIIPQDPTILSGTLRSTLDVFDEYDDADIYAALRRVHLLKEDDVQGFDGEVDETTRNQNVFRDLNNPVSEGGDNFSTGEKQLICMARAILRHNRVLLMDEATASIDYETDALISKTIREEFSESTILTIAHRIHTIIDFDKVLVMDQGRIAEYAPPAELLRNPKSRFYALCKATGRAEFANLKEMAMAAERSKRAESA